MTAPATYVLRKPDLLSVGADTDPASRAPLITVAVPAVHAVDVKVGDRVELHVAGRETALTYTIRSLGPATETGRFAVCHHTGMPGEDRPLGTPAPAQGWLDWLKGLVGWG